MSATATAVPTMDTGPDASITPSRTVGPSGTVTSTPGAHQTGVTVRLRATPGHPGSWVAPLSFRLQQLSFVNSAGHGGLVVADSAVRILGSASRTAHVTLPTGWAGGPATIAFKPVTNAVPRTPLRLVLHCGNRPSATVTLDVRGRIVRH